MSAATLGPPFMPCEYSCSAKPSQGVREARHRLPADHLGKIPPSIISAAYGVRIGYIFNFGFPAPQSCTLGLHLQVRQVFI